MSDMNGSGNPLANVAPPQQPQGAAQAQGGNPLAKIAPQLGGALQKPPAPTKAQTTAAVQRFAAVQAALRPIILNPDLGKKNLRPEVMDAASKLLGTRLLSLPEVMESIGKLPDDPLAQKQALQGIYNSAQQAEAHVLDAHGSAVAAGKLPPDGGAAYDAGSHEQHMQGLLGHYKRGC